MVALAKRDAVRDGVVCIVGMHRSGTSLIAQILNQSGLYLGAEDNLLGSNVGNPDGHFEHFGFIELNDAILAHLGGSWEFPPELHAGWEHAASLEPLRSRARDLLQTFSGKFPWGWKDPRTSLLLPFWQGLIPNLRFVICVRSPLAVVNSLHNRNKMPLRRGAYLWGRYLRASLTNTESCPRLVLCYDRFFENPAREIATLLNFCGLKPAGGAALATAIRADLRHHQNDLAALLACDEITRDVKLLYVALRALESDDKLAWQESRFDEAISSLMRLIDDSAQDQIVAQLQSRLNRSEAELADLRAEIWRDTKANHRWAYRFYRKVLRPFQLARFRSSSR